MPRRKDSFSDLPGQLRRPIEVENVFQKVSVLSVGDQKIYEAKIKKLTDEQNKYIKMERDKKFKILATHLNVDLEAKEGWRGLAEAMAVHYFEGFKVRLQLAAGPKKKWDGLTLFRLCYEIHMEQKKKEQSISSICNKLVTRSPWNQLLVSSDKEKARESLNKQYRKAQADPIVKAFMRMLDSGHEEIQKQVHHIYELVCSGEIASLPK